MPEIINSFFAMEPWRVIASIASLLALAGLMIWGAKETDNYLAESDRNYLDERDEK